MFDRLYAASEVFRDNMQFLRQYRLGDLFRNVNIDINKGEQTMVDFETDEQRLEADVQTETNLVTQVQTATQSNAAQIKTLTDEVAAAKVQGVATTAMEAALTTLEGNNQTLTSLVPAPSQAVQQSAQSGSGQAAS